MARLNAIGSISAVAKESNNRVIPGVAPAEIRVIVCLCLYAILLAMAASRSVAVLSPVGWSIVCVLTGFVSVVVSASTGTLDTFEPIHAVLMYSAFLFGVRGLVMLLLDAPVFTSPVLISTGLVLATAGMLGTYIGYCSGAGDTLADAIPRFSLLARGEGGYPSGVILGAAFIGLVGVGVFMMLMRGVHFDVEHLGSAGTFWVTPLLNCFQLALCMLLINLLEHRPLRAELGALVLFALSIVLLFFIRSSKGWLLEPLFYLAIFYHYRRKRLTFIAVFGAGLVAFVAAQLLTSYWVTFRGNVTAFELSVIRSSSTDAALWASLFSRFYGLDSMLVALKHVHNSGLLWGRSYAELCYFYIPRAIWPGKPYAWSYSYGFIMGQYVPRFAGAFTMTNGIVEMYLNFGILGVGLGAPVVGIVARASYVYLMGRIRTNSALILYAVVLRHLLQFCEGALSGTVPFFLTYLVPFLCLLGMMPSPRRDNLGHSGQGTTLGLAREKKRWS